VVIDRLSRKGVLNGSDLPGQGWHSLSSGRKERSTCVWSQPDWPPGTPSSILRCRQTPRQS
jgi:hypothetical protein